MNDLKAARARCRVMRFSLWNSMLAKLSWSMACGLFVSNASIIEKSSIVQSRLSLVPVQEGFYAVPRESSVFLTLWSDHQK